jgi:hypothetical protein
MQLERARSYEAKFDRVFAALIHALNECGAKVERVEGFGTQVTFRISRNGSHDIDRLWARVVPTPDGSKVEIGALEIAPGDPQIYLVDPNVPPRLLDAVQDRLDRGPAARP